MSYYDLIMADLKAGKSVETVAKEVSDTINKVNAELKNLENERLKQKKAEQIAKDILEYLDLSGVDASSLKVNPSDIIKSITKVIFRPEVKEVTKSNTPDDIIREFLKTL